MYARVALCKIKAHRGTLCPEVLSSLVEVQRLGAREGGNVWLRNCLCLRYRCGCQFHSCLMYYFFLCFSAFEMFLFLKAVKMSNKNFT